MPKGFLLKVRKEDFNSVVTRTVTGLVWTTIELASFDSGQEYELIGQNCTAFDFVPVPEQCGLGNVCLLVNENPSSGPVNQLASALLDPAVCTGATVPETFSQVIKGNVIFTTIDEEEVLLDEEWAKLKEKLTLLLARTGAHVNICI